MKHSMIFVMIAGLTLGFAELGYARYFAGHKFAEGVIFDATNKNAGVLINISQDNFPVRVNLTAYGWLKYNSAQPIARMEFSTGMRDDHSVIRKHFVIDERDVTSKASTGSPNTRLNLMQYNLKTYGSILLETSKPGEWNFTGKPIDEREFKFQSVEGSFIVNSRAVNWYLAGPGLFVGLLGMIGFIVAAKSS